MKILLLGGNGFIGRRLAARLIEAGHELSARPAPNWIWRVRIRTGRLGWMEWMPSPIWPARSDRASRRVRSHSPCRPIAPGCIGEGAWRPALGAVVGLGAAAHAGARFLSSKGRGDAALLDCGIEAVVARPSLIYGADGASSRLLLRLARLPFWLLPEGGGQRIQPVAAADVAEGCSA
ncbi:Uncharacterised protein [Chromobacterium violaceum]|uniref:NAD-dependent epimerase/dehydratase domain-containing protein n=1 Tax=Chromobacterium violaceum TaxID=536 RepID=A0A447TCE3_CHRVL|nr:Uncharacterised protein [Chromobacterium violaceum]